MRLANIAVGGVLGVLLLAMPASATIVSVTGDVVDAGPIPASLLNDVVPDAPNINIYLEAERYEITSAIGGIAPGIYDIYHVHFDQFPNGSTWINSSGTVTFDKRVVGLVGDSYADLDAWDTELFPLTGTSYMTGISDSPYYRRMDGGAYPDVFTFTGTSVTLSLWLRNEGLDQGRIFIQSIPEPETFVLFGIGLVALGLLKKRRST